MSSLVQTATEVDWAGFNSRTITVASVAAGDSIIVVNDMCNFASGVNTIGCSSVNDGSAYTLDANITNGITGGPLTVEVWRLHNASAGTHNIVLTSNHANSNNFGRISAFSVTGLQNAAPDVVKTNTGNSTTPQTGTSASLSQAGEFGIASMVLATTVTTPAFTSPANTGYTSITNKQTTGNLPASVDYQHFASTGTQSANWGTIAGTENWAALFVAYKDTVAASPPTITSVGSGTIKPGDTGVSIAGANFGSNTGSAAVTLIDGANSALSANCVATSWGASTIQITVAGGNVRYGAATIMVTTSGGLQASFGVTLAPPTGTSVTTMGTLIPLTFDANNKPSRLYDSPDIQSGQQVQLWASGGTGTPTVSPDGNLSVPTALNQVTWTHHDGTQWVTTSHWDMRGLFPQISGVVPTQNGVNGFALSFSIASLFSETDSASAPLTYSIAGAALPAGLSINSSTGTVSGTLSSGAGTFSGVIAQATNADGSYAQSAPFSIIVAANTNVTFTGTILDLPNLATGQIVSIDTTPFFQNATSYTKTGTLPDGLAFAAGVISGTLTGVGITPGQTQAYAISITGSNANPSSANSNTFTLSVNNPVIVVPASPTLIPTVKSSTLTLVETGTSLKPAQQVIPYISQNDVVTFREVCPMGANDVVGVTYRFFKIPSSALVDKLELANDANPSRSLYRCGVLMSTTRLFGSGGPPVPGADAIFFDSVSFDTARTSPVTILQPAIANQLPTIAARKLRIWQLLGYASDPQQVYDVAITALAPGQNAGSIFLSLQYERGANNWYAP